MACWQRLVEKVDVIFLMEMTDHVEKHGMTGFPWQRQSPAPAVSAPWRVPAQPSFAVSQPTGAMHPGSAFPMQTVASLQPVAGMQMPPIAGPAMQVGFPSQSAPCHQPMQPMPFAPCAQGPIMQPVVPQGATACPGLAQATQGHITQAIPPQSTAPCILQAAPRTPLPMPEGHPQALQPADADTKRARLQ